jgi:hypothetical protein
MRKAELLISILIALGFLFSCKKKEVVSVADRRDVIIGKYSCFTHYASWNMWFDSTQWQNTYWDSSTTQNRELIILKGNIKNRITCDNVLFDAVSDTAYTFYAAGEYPSPFARNIIFDTLHKTITYYYFVTATKYSSRTESYIGTRVP